MKNKKSLKASLKKGGIGIGAWCALPSSSVINIIGTAGLDFVIIDMEHGPSSFETVEDMVRAAETEGCEPLVRVAKNDEALILNALDIGAHGVVVPHIKSKSEAELAISYIKYHPLGQRGFSPFTRAGRYSPENVTTHAELQNKKTIVALILEGKDGISNLESILGIQNIREKVDVIYIGAYDLSQALGFPGKVDCPQVKKYLEDCIKRIKKAGIAAGGYVAKDSKDLAWMCEMGMQFITLLPDCAVLFHAFRSLINDFREVKSKLNKNRS